MLVDDSSLKLDDLEAELASVLASEDGEPSRQRACELLEVVLARVLWLLPVNRGCRYWHLDDLSCELVHRAGDVARLSGVATWISGGENCDRFRIDVAVAGKPLLYSYKFTNGATSEQILYVGKTPEGWVVNGP